MIETYRRLQRRRAAGEIEGGFTLIELLIVIVVLGILAAVVVFALGGVTGKSVIAACQADAKTVGVGVAALQAENPNVVPTAGNASVSGSWQADLTGNTLAGAPFLQSYPTGAGTPPAYTITVAVAGGTLANGTTLTNDTTPVTPNAGDVIVNVSTKSYDATQFPIEACATA